jgi:hypothetical protein
MLDQLASNPQQLQQVLQQGMQPPQQPQVQQIPTNPVVHHLAALTIWSDPKLTMEMKINAFKEYQIAVPQEIQIEIRNNQLKLQEKQLKIAQNVPSGESTNVDLSKI